MVSKQRNTLEDLGYIFVDENRMRMIAHSINGRSSNVKRCPTKSSAAFLAISTIGFSASRIECQVVQRGRVPRTQAPHVNDSISADICAICSALPESHFTSDSSCRETDVYRLATWSQNLESIAVFMDLRWDISRGTK